MKGTILLGAHVNADDVYNMLTDYENASRVFPSTIKKVEYLGFEEEELEDGEARRPVGETHKTDVQLEVFHIRWEF